jgi:hypothetical protein
MASTFWASPRNPELLGLGERKSLQTDRVILVPGPELRLFGKFTTCSSLKTNKTRNYEFAPVFERVTENYFWVEKELGAQPTRRLNAVLKALAD